MTHRIAFAGFRHPHIFSLWTQVKEHTECEVVAAWENDPVTRAQLKAEREVDCTHDTFDGMLRESGCTIVALGDVFAHRGAQAIAALQAGKHVISDKPICTDLAELDQIARLAKENGLSIGCQLDLVESGVMQQLKKVIGEGKIGSVCTITITAQHPLRLGSRAAWYFEPGLHGGSINDIGVHVFDLAPWLTGSPWKELIFAREWNAKAASVPHFKDCAQFLAVLECGATCFADVSYLAPDTLGYELPQYWRVTIHGTKGMAETCFTQPHLIVVTNEDTVPQKLPPLAAPTGYLQNFLDEICNSPSTEGLTTARVLTSARSALEAQATAQRTTL